jgi:hypothetical protein
MPPRQCACASYLREPAAETVCHHDTQLAADVLDHGRKVCELRLSAVPAMRRPAQPDPGTVIDYERADNLGQPGKYRRPPQRYNARRAPAGQLSYVTDIYRE